MTTEREFQEWAEKIRHVRGQAPLRPAQRPQKMSPLILVILFICGLAIATAFRNYQQQQAQPRWQRTSLSVNQF
ncbi:hypothetical protein FLX56_20090 [Synechococcus moorigangaii CMS01]|nr:hypothetical protein [Synechococcus moorigangaii CMS01]